MPKILIADDSIAVRKVAERLLTEAGMGVTLAANGSEALALLSKDRPDLIVSDVIMPDKSGYEVCAYIRAQSNLADLPVLLISGIVNDEVARQAESCKADGVLKKPFQGSSLKDRVLDLLSKRPKKSVPELEQPQRQPAVEPSITETVAAAPIVLVPKDTKPTSVEDGRHQPIPEPLAVRAEEPEPILMTSEAVLRPAPAVHATQPDVSAQAHKQQQAILAERDARILALEAQLDDERRRNQEQMQRLLDEQREQVAALSSQAQVLDQTLAAERAQCATLSEQLEEVSRQVHRIGDMEAALAEAQGRAEQLSQEVAEGARRAARIAELEAHLAAEREAATQLVQQITSLEQAEQRMHELETTLAAERETAQIQRHERAELETIASMVPALEEACAKARAELLEGESALSAERDAASALLMQVKQLEVAAERARELDLALAAEQERSMQLTKRAEEAEHMAQQSTRRFEDMARKLGEIAGLASQLGNGKR
ncbi:MAG: response regulator [Nitrospira sp.]|nr:response regulator [Nitrospira sp.]MBP6604849.1 response regulator [Nitrospira sp.]HQY57911.1 response regulator [Nitrospira sp.]HRA95872.1 response regulator [Nitrospira sp.]